MFHIFFILTLCFLADYAFASQTMSLAQCLEAGMKNNPTLQASEFKSDAVGRDVKVARADFLPSLTSSYAANRINSNATKGPTNSDYINQDIHSATIKLTQVLYAGSRISNNYERAKFLEQASQAERDLVKLELIYNIETTFYRVMKAKQDVIAATEAVDRLTESAKAAEAFFRKELIPYVDVLKAKVDLADADNQLGVAKNNENRQRVTLFSLMNLPMDPDLEFSDETKATVRERPSFESCFSYAVEHRPDIKSLEYQRQAADKQSEVSLGKYMPVIRFEAGYYDVNNDYEKLGRNILGSYDLDQTNRYWLAGVSVTWDLFDGGRSWYESEKFSLDSQRLGALRQEAHNTIATGIRKALYSLQEAEQRLASSTGALAAAKENYTSEDNRLKAGVSTMTALLDAQSRLVRAQVNKSSASLDYNLAHSELKFMTGGKDN